MKECDVCGNEIPDHADPCPFCETPQRKKGAASEGTPRHWIVTVNLEEGMPTVEKALSQLDAALQRARTSGVRLVRVIHGYGSTGVGGRLREAVRIQLSHLSRCKRIRMFIPGEERSPRSAEIRRLMKRYPRLARSERTDTKNPGITLVEL